MSTLRKSPLRTRLTLIVMIGIALCLPLLARIELLREYTWLLWGAALVLLITALVIAVWSFQFRRKEHLSNRPHDQSDF